MQRPHFAFICPNAEMPLNAPDKQAGNLLSPSPRSGFRGNDRVKDARATVSLGRSRTFKKNRQIAGYITPMNTYRWRC